MQEQTTARKAKVGYWSRRGVPVEQRFWTKVEKTATCWIWRAALNNKGYGQIGDHGVTKLAHRLSLEWALGRTLRRDEDTRHSCDNRQCVNPAHLAAGSRSQNMLDAVERGGIRLTLTPTDTQIVRDLSASGWTQAAIARKFQVGATTIRRIVRGRQ